MDTIIRNGLIITADGRFPGSIGIKDGAIGAIYKAGEEPTAAEVIDAKGLAIVPGVIDMHSHHREGSEPGFEYKDTIYTATLQCAAAGVTTSVAMPNVNPPPRIGRVSNSFRGIEEVKMVVWQLLLRASISLWASMMLILPASAESLNVMVFQGVQNWPILAAQEKRMFAKYNLTINKMIAPNSTELRNGLKEGRYQIVHTSVDNAVAMAEHQGADIAVILGGDNGWNDLYVQPEITGYNDLIGKIAIVDAVDTAFAFQLYQMLKIKNIDKSLVNIKAVGATRFRLSAITTDKTISASMFNLPFSLQAERSGLKKLDTATDVIGPYLSTTGFVMRAWGNAHRAVLVRYIQAYLDGLAWVLDPENKQEATSILAKDLGITADMAETCYAIATDAKNGFAKQAEIDMEGLRNVLKLRAEQHGDWGGTPPSPQRYLDLTFYNDAIQSR